MLYYVDSEKLKLTTKSLPFLGILDLLLFFSKCFKNHILVLESEGPLSFFPTGFLEFVRKCGDSYS